MALSGRGAVDTAFDAVILAGGAARRLGGADKASLMFGDRTSLNRVLDAVRAAAQVIVVGPRRPTVRPVTWCRESPPGAGPVAALQTGILLASAPTVAVLAVDLPLIDSVLINELRLAGAGRDGAILIDGGGRTQYLCGVYRRDALADAVTGLAPDAPVRRAVERLALAAVPDSRDAGADADTWDQVSRLRRRFVDGFTQGQD